MIDWQPIETAPKDGTYVLIFVPTMFQAGGFFVAYWDEDKFAKNPHPRWESSDRLYSRGDARIHKPTHWAPITAPGEAV